MIATSSFSVIGGIFLGGWLKVPEPWVVDSCWEREWSRKGVNLPTPHSELSTTLQNTLLELGSLLPGSRVHDPAV